ncbi:PIN domain-like protein, partial [Schizophyllum commune]
QVLKPAAAPQSYSEVFVSNQSVVGNRSLRVGVDAEGLMRSVQAVFKKRGHVQHGMNPELWTLFCIICRFARQPGVFIFIFDGPEKAHTKRGKHVLSQPLWLVQHLTSMIEKFGYYHRTATGEAEVELCHLQQLGAIDLIFTEDSDVWAYGATQVVRRLTSKSIPQDLAVYSSDHIQQHLGLTTAGFILFALVNGGDYDVGLPGVGPRIAYGLAHTRLGDELLEIVNAGQAHFEARIPVWRAALIDELATNRSGFLKNCERAVAAKVPLDFPSLEIVQRYTSPASSVIDGQ